MKKYTFFWSGPFSQWHLSLFTLEGIQFNCGEQYKVYQKAMLFADNETAMKILEEQSPSMQKMLGKCVNGFEEEVWVQERERIVYRGNYARFVQNPWLYEQLTKIEGTELVNASPDDAIWGIGLAAKDPRALDERNWKGQNLLGKILTQLREDLKMKNFMAGHKISNKRR